MAKPTLVRKTIVRLTSAIVIWFGAFLSAEPISFEPQVANGECSAYWKHLGFSSQGEVGKNALFQIDGKETYSKFYQRLKRDSCFKEWTILVYMAADNDLSPFSYRDLWEMESVGSTVSVDVIVFHDSAVTDKMRYLHVAKNPNHSDYSEALETYVENEGLGDQESKTQELAFLEAKGTTLSVSPNIQTLPEGDSGNVKTFSDFLEFAISRYPSRRLMVVGWSHGQGFDARLNSDEASKAVGSGWQVEQSRKEDRQTNQSRDEGRQGGFAFDSFPKKSHMAVTEMASRVRSLLKRYRQSVPLDIFGSDACLNQQVEFGYEWMGLAQYVFGSSTIVQKKGFNYRTLFRWFEDHPYHETNQLAAQIPLLYGGSVGSGAGKKYSSYYDPYATMATWTMPELLFLRRALEDLGAILFEWISNSDKPLTKIKRINSLRTVIEQTLRLGSVSQDLFNLLQQLENWAKEKKQREEEGPWDAVLTEINNTRQALSRAVLSKYLGKKYVSGLLKTSQGVAIWLPTSETEFAEMYPKFAKSRFYQKEGDPKSLSQWAKFVESLYL